MNKMKVLVLLFAMTVGVVSIVPTTTYAVTTIDTQCAGVTDSQVCQDAKSASPNNFVRTIVNILLFIVGALSVIVLIIGGILYTISGGDAGQLTRAKNTITYAIIGIVVAFLAYAIVNFVIARFK